ncbi:hypothetical protein J8273_8601 [Carpediemonas membranifera]|uniref:Uncharacterized protein n=1 Tax=Carpediemonas membranifera TaxID=201153 RepID=A0A8J6AXU7_9EUKA|nr:hypothetical protein J8273_8601 [Carpediemonas membranifera]|eukprot:KAG9389914.1 hypothetical protein J8273_8601 [Carpediemonas membranifera]
MRGGRQAGINLGLLASSNMSLSGLSLEEEYLQRHLGQLQKTYGSDEDSRDHHSYSHDQRSSTASGSTKGMQRNLPTSSIILADIRERVPPQTSSERHLLSAATELREIREFHKFISARPRAVRLLAVRRFFEAWTPFTVADSTPSACHPPSLIKSGIDEDASLSSELESGDACASDNVDVDEEIDTLGMEDADWARSNIIARSEEVRQARVAGITRQRMHRARFDREEQRYHRALIKEDEEGQMGPIGLAHDRLSAVPKKVRTPTAVRPLLEEEEDETSGESETQSNLEVMEDLISLLACKDSSALDFYLNLIPHLKCIDSEEAREEVLAYVAHLVGEELGTMQSFATESGAATFFASNMSPNKAGTVQQRPRAEAIPTEPPRTPVIAQSANGTQDQSSSDQKSDSKSESRAGSDQDPGAADLEFDTDDTDTDTGSVTDCDNDSNSAVSDSYLPTELDSQDESDVSSAARSIDAAIRQGSAQMMHSKSGQSEDAILDRSYDYSEDADAVSTTSVDSDVESDFYISRTVDDVINSLMTSIAQSLPTLTESGQFSTGSADRLITLIFPGEGSSDLIAHVQASVQRHIGAIPFNSDALIADVRSAFECYGKQSAKPFEGVLDLEADQGNVGEGGLGDEEDNGGFAVVNIRDSGLVVQQEFGIDGFKEALLERLPEPAELSDDVRVE